MGEGEKRVVARLDLIEEFFARKVIPVRGLMVSVAGWPPPRDHYAILDLLNDNLVRDLANAAKGSWLEFATPSFEMTFDGFTMKITTDKDSASATAFLAWDTITASGRTVKEALENLLKALKERRDNIEARMLRAEEAVRWFEEVWGKHFDIDTSDVKAMRETLDNVNKAVETLEKALSGQA